MRDSEKHVDRMKFCPRRLGEANELVMVSRKLVPWLIVAGLLLLPARDNLVNLIAFRGAAEVFGVLNESEETNFSINEDYVLRFFYSYTVDGTQYNGYSYSRSSVADKPTVQISPFNPALSRIKGTTYAYLGGMGFWIMVMPIGLILLLLVARVRSVLRCRALLIKGKLASAELIDKTQSGKVNEEPRYTLTYRVDLPNGETRQFKNHYEKPGFAEKTLVLYHPKRSYMRSLNKLDYLPSMLRAAGHWDPPPKGKVFRSAIWLLVALMLVSWAAIRISLTISGG